MSQKTKYQKAIDFIALNDNNGSEFALDQDEIEGYLSVILVSETFDKNVSDIAEDVLKVRRKVPK